MTDSDANDPAVERLIRSIYAAFNARDVERVLAALGPDVDWPNVADGTRIHGHDAVRAYWTAQFAAIDPRVEPLALRPLADGRVAVDVHQRIQALDGTLLHEEPVVHVYSFRDGLITRMDVESPDV
ncbi:nuclear transport factor 2 family protein [Conexibacter stalactiti]|uniref:Nuclear transport factor 2 family protein n=1 Tax=Conexibacter stalactiti TaxID=1940611 RepID=A0ABU4HZX2_9ACTN|nr:nuclear transport factor 2 family protein [Conexibacter stalactiti]MDW5598881.1 nuclear transport factor 2 family protein [Conexibacter stalactiti]MEC5039523.1 nuclear transport factor 2 family protein [Conexibacter stalactiti]